MFKNGVLLLVALAASTVGPRTLLGDDFLLAEGGAWPGEIWISRGGDVSPYYARAERLADDLTPRVQSLTSMASGEIAFCSGLDRTVIALGRTGERRLHHGGGLVRQVRTDRAGLIYWSGLETPLDNNPLPDGVIYRINPASGEATTLHTFSQGDVGNDWWGAFDIFQDKIFAGTSRDKTTIYDVSASPVRRICQLPFAATAFRFREDGSLYACDGKGELYLIRDLARSETIESVLSVRVPFVDFEVLREAL